MNVINKLIVISQPFKGLTEEEFILKRHLAEQEVVQVGYKVVKPQAKIASLTLAKNKYVLYLGHFLNTIAMYADGVYFLNGWEQVDSCKIEHTICETYGIPIYYEPFTIKE